MRWEEQYEDYRYDPWLEEEYEKYQQAEYEKHYRRMQDCLYSDHNQLQISIRNVVCYCGELYLNKVRVFI